MGSFLRLIGAYIILGAACKAGEELWDKVLRDKVTTIANDLKKKKNQQKEIKTES